MLPPALYLAHFSFSATIRLALLSRRQPRRCRLLSQHFASIFFIAFGLPEKDVSAVFLEHHPKREASICKRRAFVDITARRRHRRPFYGRHLSRWARAQFMAGLLSARKPAAGITTSLCAMRRQAWLACGLACDARRSPRHLGRASPPISENTCFPAGSSLCRAISRGRARQLRLLPRHDVSDARASAGRISGAMPTFRPRALVTRASAKSDATHIFFFAADARAITYRLLRAARAAPDNTHAGHDDSSFFGHVIDKRAFSSY